MFLCMYYRNQNIRPFYTYQMVKKKMKYLEARLNQIHRSSDQQNQRDKQIFSKNIQYDFFPNLTNLNSKQQNQIKRKLLRTKSKKKNEYLSKQIYGKINLLLTQNLPQFQQRNYFLSKIQITEGNQLKWNDFNFLNSKSSNQIINLKFSQQQFGLHIKNMKIQNMTIRQKYKRKNNIKKLNSMFKERKIIPYKIKINKKKILHKIIQKQYSFKNQIRQTKMQKYISFLSKIQFSNRVAIPLNQLFQKYQKGKFKQFLVCIGKGNNCNLVRSIFKIRWWWKQTNNIEKADFIWTQLKVSEIYQCQKKGQLNYFCQEKKQKKIQIASYQFKWKKQSQQKLYLKLFHQIDYREFKKLHKQISDYYCKKNVRNEPKFFYPCQKKMITKMSNHLEFNFNIGNKKGLFFILQKYCKFFNLNLNTKIPVTFHINNSFENQFKIFQQYAKNRQKNIVWILKPGQNSNRGSGISILSSVQSIKKQILENKKYKSFIIQQYILKPFLYFKRKFDIRTYLMITAVGGRIKGYWYQEGYLKTSSEQFNLNDLKDSFIHLTNDAIQKNQIYTEDSNKQTSYHILNSKDILTCIITKSMTSLRKFIQK